MSTIKDKVTGFRLGRGTGSENDLLDKAFATHCSSDSQPRPRIMAICGITDEGDEASPNESGWFVSDFYLFFHLLQPDDTFPNTDPTKQLWFTCEPPSCLVAKYTEYAHGSPRGDRRVVLEAPLLQGIEDSGRLRLAGRLDLLQDFLSHLREQSQLAFENEEPLLILVFGHGEETYEVIIGGEGEPKDRPKLLIEDVKEAIYPGAQVTLLITSCYSGGWLVRPDLNITGVTASSPDEESYSWPKSASIGRASGGEVASSILQALIKPEYASPDAQANPTYIRLSACVWDTLSDISHLASFTEMRFSAQDDRWDMAYRTRSGIPLLSYKNRWESLRLLRRGSLGNGAVPGCSRRTIIERSLCYVGSVTGSPKLYALQNLARKYLRSFPGPDQSGANLGLHGKLRRLLEDPNGFDREKVEDCIKQVSYRLDAMREADRIRAFMNLKFPSIFEIDVYKWEAELPFDRQTRDLKEQLYNLLRTKMSFSRPAGAGLGYAKPRKYLVMALIDSGLGWEEIEKSLDAALQHKPELASAVFRKYRRVIGLRSQISALRNEFMGCCRKVQRRMPTHRHYME